MVTVLHTINLKPGAKAPEADNWVVVIHGLKAAAIPEGRGNSRRLQQLLQPKPILKTHWHLRFVMAKAGVCIRFDPQPEGWGLDVVVFLGFSHDKGWTLSGRDDKRLSGLKPVVCIRAVPQPKGWGY